ncbi:MAG TPA: molecular chaperone DnaJ, partial [Anaeromyxobacter sp.]
PPRTAQAPPSPEASPGQRARAPARPEDLPRRRLRFAEFLYYSGRVRWSDLADAIAWQRTQRPPLGRIAVDFGFLAPDDPGVILERRREAGAHAVPFGEWAVRLGYLRPFQLLAALGHQLRLQRPIGQFFVERRMLAPDEIEDVRRRILRHNSRFSA